MAVHKANSQKKFYFFIGTVAEFGKLTPIMREFQKRKIKFQIIDSGQNQINYPDFKDYLGEIKPDIKLVTKTNKSSMMIFIYWVFQALFKGINIFWNEFHNLPREKVFIIVHGDTVTSTLGALLGKLFHLKVVHVEAGYLSGNFLEPFPEEICKTINSSLADILFAPTDWAFKNIAKFKGVKVSTYFNTNIESFWWAMKKKVNAPKFIKEGKYYLLIVHRQEHVLFRKKWTKTNMQFVINNAPKNLTCVLLNHPLTVEIINSLNLGKRKIKIISQLTYPEFLKVLKGAEFIATDSATIQQEAYYLGKPYLGLTDFSVQTEGIGQNAVISNSDFKIMGDFFKNYKLYQKKPIQMKKSPAKIVVDTLLKF